MKGYLSRVLIFYGGIFVIVNPVWIITGLSLMSVSRERMGGFASRAALTWLGCFLAGMAIASYLAGPVHEGLKKLGNNTLSDHELHAVHRRNLFLPWYLCLLMTGMIAVFGASVHVFSPADGAVPVFFWWITISGAGLVLPACLFGALHHATHPVHDRMYQEYRSRSLTHISGGFHLGERIIWFFSAVSTGIVLWAGAIGFSGGTCRAQGMQADFVIALGAVVLLCIAGLAGFALFTMAVAPVKKTADMIGHLSAGGWSRTARLTVHWSDEMGQMAAGFNELMDRIGETVAGMEKAAASVDRSSRDVSCRAGDLMNLLLEQAASVEAVAQTIDQMTAFIKQNALSAESGRDKTRSMVNRAGRSEVSMRSLVEAMDGISLASRKIGDIVSTVNEVAFQTNLLALNAAVEAARAGEHGRGFAVVAGEVRALAQRSADAARQIKVLIEDTVTRIRAGDELAKNAKKSITGIIEEIGDLSETIEGFASTSSEQAGGVDDLNKSVASMDSVTQRNAAAIHQLSDTAEIMFSSAGSLAGDVARFKQAVSRHHADGSHRSPLSCGRDDDREGELE